MDRGARRRLEEAVVRLPLDLERPVQFQIQPQLTAWRGRLLSCGDKGTPVHAAAFIRERRIVLDAALADQPDTMGRIVAHELFHFVWVALGNAKRTAYTDVLVREVKAHARGELGESAAVAKVKWQRRSNPLNWKQYVLESFCDSAAAFYASPATSDWTLAPRWRTLRRAWFSGTCPPLGWRC